MLKTESRPRTKALKPTKEGQRPVIRWAELLRSVPPLSKHAALAVAHRLAKDWERQERSYLAMVSAETGFQGGNLAVQQDERVRVRKDGKTPVVDFPRIRVINDGPRAFDTRICIAVCNDHYSSKAWCRVGPRLPEFSTETIDDALLEFYRLLAKKSAEWAGRFLKATLVAMYPKQEVEQKGTLEVSMISSDSPELGHALEGLDEPDLTARELLTDRDARSRVQEFLRPLVGPDETVEAIFENHPEAFWFSSPATVVAEGTGELDTQEALFLMREFSGRAQIVGIGYDTSADGSLAGSSALRVARWVANRV